jgi:hypothetical protein|tara:strand:+ start:211 stop:456 length:246 start_codon:yes stop_codon:yes gene_type:complete
MTVFGPSDNQTATNVVAFLSNEKLITALNDLLAVIRDLFAAFNAFYRIFSHIFPGTCLIYRNFLIRPENNTRFMYTRLPDF